VTTGERPIFVVELMEAPLLAFEAVHAAQAASFAQATWFKNALVNYLCSKRAGRPTDFRPRVRPATKAEEATYRPFAHEFADMSGSFLFAPVSEEH
jgi:hypothetical protein